MVKRKLHKKKKVEMEDVLPKKSVLESEDRQLMWMIVIIVAVIGGMVVFYSVVESTRSFRYAGVDWIIEDYGEFDVYHARFASLTGANLNYNLYLRNDPRKNDVPISGEFKSFRHGGYVSLSQEVEACRGDFFGSIVGLGAFLKSGLGMKQVDIATSDAEFSAESNVSYINCNNTDRSVFMIDIGKNRVVQDDANRFCYDIYINDCNDILAIEKFMTEIVAAYSEGD